MADITIGPVVGQEPRSAHEMEHEYTPPPCIHGDGTNLCDDCQDIDPKDYWEYGDHPEGLRRWRELQQELQDMSITEPCLPCPESDIPF